MVRIAGVIVLLTGMMMSGPVEAQYNTSPNLYQNMPRHGGGSTLYGYNPGTGSTWNNTYDRRGNSSGIDSRGRAWSYDRGSGTYYNYGSGQMRYGAGQGSRRR